MAVSIVFCFASGFLDAKGSGFSVNHAGLSPVQSYRVSTDESPMKASVLMRWKLDAPTGFCSANLFRAYYNLPPLTHGIPRETHPRGNSCRAQRPLPGIVPEEDQAGVPAFIPDKVATGSAGCPRVPMNRGRTPQTGRTVSRYASMAASMGMHFIQQSRRIAQRLRRARVHTVPTADTEAVLHRRPLFGKVPDIDGHGAGCRAAATLHTFRQVCLNTLSANLGKARQQCTQRAVIAIPSP